MTDDLGKKSPVSWTTASISVLVPAFNEEANLEPTVQRLVRALSITVEEFELIVVNDGSTDRTAEVANSLPSRYPEVRVIQNRRRMGLGYCYLLGVDAARKSFFVYIPGDNTWPYRSFLELFGNLGKADLVTSYSTNPEVRPLARRAVSAMYTRVLNTVFDRRMHYYNGLTIYPLYFLRTKPVSTYGFGFQAEVLLKALSRGLSFVEVALPIDERTAGKSKAVTLRNILSVVFTVARLFWQLRVAGRFAAGADKQSSVRTPNAEGKTSTQTPQELGLHIMSQAEDEKAPGRSSDTKSQMTIIVAGASSGIGAALTRALAADGHNLIVCARRVHLLDEVTEGNKLALGLACDIADECQVRNFFSKVSALTPGVDALINCAGGFGAIGPLDTLESSEWMDTIKVNLFGPYLMIKHTLPLLLKSKWPSIINFAGGGAFSPFPNYSAYACSKAAVVRLTECLAAELASRGVMVNAIAPGIVATEAHQATLAAGEQRAGVLHYRRTQAVLREGGAPMENVINCTRTLLSPGMHGLTGKTISANFDPWDTPAFRQRIAEISRSDLYTMRRFNIVNLPEGILRVELAEAWGRRSHYE